MIIAVPVEENEIEICPSFGRTPLFYIYDTDSKTGKYIENDAMNAPGGAGIKAAQTVMDEHAEVVLVPRCGENAAKVLETAGIKLYESVGLSLENNIQAFLEHNLAVLTNIHPGFHGTHGGK